MAEGNLGADRGGEPAPALVIDQQSVVPGNVVHIRLLGPQGGQAEADLVPIAPAAREIGEHGNVESQG